MFKVDESSKINVNFSLYSELKLYFTEENNIQNTNGRKKS